MQRWHHLLVHPGRKVSYEGSYQNVSWTHVLAFAIGACWTLAVFVIAYALRDRSRVVEAQPLRDHTLSGRSGGHRIRV